MSELLPGFRTQLEARAGELDRAGGGEPNAAATLTAAAPQPVARPSHEAKRERRDQRTRRWRRPHGRGLAAVVLVAGAGVGGIAYAATTTLWRPTLGGTPAGHATATPSSVPANQLKVLGVLRRPQTELDRNVTTRYALRFNARGERVRTNAVRRLGTGAMGGAVVLVPYERRRNGMWGPPDASRDPKGFSRDILCFNLLDPFGSAGVGCGTVDDVLAGKFTMGMSSPACGSPEQRRGHRESQAREDRWARLEGRAPKTIPCEPRLEPIGPSRWVAIVPDGVATIQLGRRPGSRRVPVHDNLAQFTGGSGFTHDHVWLDVAGRPIPRKLAALRARFGLAP